MTDIWSVRLGHQAEQDYVAILQWTTRMFGETQARRYSETLAMALMALREGPAVLGAKKRDEIAPGIQTLP